MIAVEGIAGDITEIEDATRFSTDEHNNLEIWLGDQGDRLARVFARGQWVSVGVEDAD